MFKSIGTLTEDSRPKRNGWAPGAYVHQCFTCHEYFLGDKRAITCAPCAYRTKEPSDNSVS